MKSEDQIALDQNSPVLYIEHCRSWRVFRRRAEELHAALQTRLQNAGQQFQLQLQLNAQGAPRRGAFELSFAPNPSTDTTEQHLIWSGWKRTPRAQKFPDPDEMCEQIIKLYNEHSKSSEPENTEKPKPASRTPSPTTNPIAATSSDKEKQTKPKRSSRTPSLTQNPIASSSSEPGKQTKRKRTSQTPSPTSAMPSTSKAAKRRKASAKSN